MGREKVLGLQQRILVLKRRTWLLSAQDSVPPSKVQRGRVGIPGDFSVLEVRVVEVA